MHFECCQTAGGSRQSRRQPSKPAGQPPQKQHRNLLPPPFSVHATNKKGEYASTKPKKNNAQDEGHSLPHDELAQEWLMIHTPIGIMQVLA